MSHLPRACKIHGEPISGISYKCERCKSDFCSKCIDLVLAGTGECMVCGEKIASMDQMKQLFNKTCATPPPVRKCDVTIFSDEVWTELDEMNLDEEIIDELLNQLKYVEPKNRVLYLKRCFEDMDRMFDGIFPPIGRL